MVKFYIQMILSHLHGEVLHTNDLSHLYGEVLHTNEHIQMEVLHTNEKLYIQMEVFTKFYMQMTLSHLPG